MGNLFDTRTAIFDPATDGWTAGPAKGASSSEESWVLLPDDTVVTVRCDGSRRADKYVAGDELVGERRNAPDGHRRDLVERDRCWCPADGRPRVFRRCEQSHSALHAAHRRDKPGYVDDGA